MAFWSVSVRSWVCSGKLARHNGSRACAETQRRRLTRAFGLLRSGDGGTQVGELGESDGLPVSCSAGMLILGL